MMQNQKTGSACRRIMAIGIMAVWALSASAALLISGNPAFERFIGPVNPFAVLLVLSAILVWIAPIAEHSGIFSIVGENWRGGLFTAALAAAGFGVIVVIADALIVFPRDMNVPLPGALLFYPAMAFGIEVLFHALPVFLLALLFAGRGRKAEFTLGIMLIVASFEALLQVFAFTADQAGAGTFVLMHLYAINLAQLLIFRWYGFVSMLAMRLFYYAVWHITWGTWRLELLF